MRLTSLAHIMAGGPAAIDPKTGAMGPGSGNYQHEHGDAQPETHQWEKVGEQKGSNPGGTYKDPISGRLYYAKMYSNPDQGRTEVLANKIYRAMGINAPDSFITKINGKEAVASSIIKGVTPMPMGHEGYNDPNFKKGFIVDAWLANHDVVGLTHDNVMKGEDGKIYRTDNGGTMFFRAQGSHKTIFEQNKEHVPELDSMRDSNIAKQAGPIFKGITDADLKPQAQELWDKFANTGEIPKLVKEAGFENPMSTTLTAHLYSRLGAIAKRYEIGPFVGYKEIAANEEMLKKAGFKQFADGAKLWRNDAKQLDMVIEKNPDNPTAFKWSVSTKPYDDTKPIVKGVGPKSLKSFLDDKNAEEFLSNQKYKIPKAPKTIDVKAYLQKKGFAIKFGNGEAIIATRKNIKVKIFSPSAVGGYKASHWVIQTAGGDSISDSYTHASGAAGLKEYMESDAFKKSVKEFAPKKVKWSKANKEIDNFVQHLSQGGSYDTWIHNNPDAEKGGVPALNKIVEKWKGVSQNDLRSQTLEHINSGGKVPLPEDVKPLMLAAKHAPKVDYPLYRIMYLGPDSFSMWKRYAEEKKPVLLAPMGYSMEKPEQIENMLGTRNTWLYLDKGSYSPNYTRLDSHSNEKEHIPSGKFIIKSAQWEYPKGWSADKSLPVNTDIPEHVGKKFVIRLRQVSAVSAKKNPTHSVSTYKEGSPMKTIFDKLSSKEGQEIPKSELMEGLSKGHAMTALSWIKIHGDKNGLWKVYTDKHKGTVKLEKTQ